MMSNKSLMIASLTVALALTSGCATDIDNYGYVPDKTLIGQLEKGKQSKEEVKRLLGTPSAIGTFEDNRWYYISKKVERWAFMPAKTLEQRVLIVEFEPASAVIADIKNLDLNNARDIAMVKRETPTRGKELNVLEQLLQNVGRFNPGGTDAPTGF